MDVQRITEAHIKGPNTSLHFPPNQINGERVLEGSIARDEDIKNKKVWGIGVSDPGRVATNYLDIAFLVGIARNYFNSFLASDTNPFATVIARALSTISSVFEAKRDEMMYEEIYSVGINTDLTPEEIRDQNQTVSSGKVPFIDDFLENKREEMLYGEYGVARVANWAYKAAKIKPVAHFIGGILGDKYRIAVESVLDKPAQFWWRLRFFGDSLHKDFVSTVWELVTSNNRKEIADKLDRESAIYFKSKYAESKYAESKYAESKYPDKAVPTSKHKLGLYLKMLVDMMKQHFLDILYPKKALERKLLPGNGYKNRTENPDGTFSHGYIDPGSKEDQADQADQADQRRASIVDFTGPICAGLGLISATIFDPLKIIWGLFGIEKGHNVLSALSSVRKSFQLINYVPRFLIPEFIDGKKYFDDEVLIGKIKGGDASDAEKQLHHLRLERYLNAITTMFVATGSILEPIYQFKKPSFADNRFLNFLFDSFVKFNDDFFLRFFSKRRWCQGLTSFIQSISTSSDLGFMKERINEAREVIGNNGRQIGPIEEAFLRISKGIYNLKTRVKGLPEHLELAA